MKPVVSVEERQDGTRVRVTVGDAQVWVRATPGGRRLEVGIDEGEGGVDVQWSIQRADPRTMPVAAGAFVQSPYREASK